MVVSIAVQVFMVLLLVVGPVFPTDLDEYQDLHHEQHHEPKKPIIPILKQTFDQHKDGYHFSYETGNGIHAEESGYFKKGEKEHHDILVQQGTITYHDEHGHPITLTYIADEHGFQPQGAHLPTPPPIPEEIQKSLHDISNQPEYEPEQPHLPAYFNVEAQEYHNQHQHQQE